MYDKDYKAPPLLMNETTIGSEIRNPNQKFIYLYDFNKNWSFLVELINVSKEENPKISYPSVSARKVLRQANTEQKDCWVPSLPMSKKNMTSQPGAEGFAEKDEEGEDLGLNEDATAADEEEA